MDSLSGFTVFVRVAETRSIVGAARTLGVSASAVGKRVARLEEKLGVRLFHRSTRSITLTAEGSLFLERSRRILAEIEATELELSQSRETPRGRLRVSLPLVSGLVLPTLADFMQAYPDIELDLDFSDRVVDVVDEGFDVEDGKITVDFIPYRGDFARGIFCTEVVTLDRAADKAEIVAMYKDFYRDAAFTHYVEKAPDLKQVVNTNKALVHLDTFGRKVVVTVMIDNLLKGAVGQAVQNMNIMFNIDEKAGLALKASAF